MIIDITQPVSPGMAVFPGDAPYEDSWTFRIGPGCPVNVSRVAFSVHCGTHADACGADAVRPHLDGAPPRILLRLVDSTDPKVWPKGFRALAPDCVDLLAARGAVLVGIDTPSVDPETSKDLPSHMAAKRAGLRILENLVLAHVKPGDYELIALPLRLDMLDASPVRAVLRPL